MHNPQKAFWDYFWFTKYFMQATGIIPIGGKPSTWKTVLADYLPACPILYGSYILVPRINFILFQNHTMDDLFEGCVIAIAVFGGIIRSIDVFVHRNKIRCLLKNSEMLWNQSMLENDKDVILIWARKARFFSMAYFCAAQIPITTFILIATVKQVSSPENSTTRYYPFQFQEDFAPSPQYEIDYLLQIIAGYTGMTFIVAADMTGILLAFNMCGQLDVIRNWLMDIQRNTLHDNKSMEVILKKCIHRHQIVMDICSDLEEVVCYINLVQVVTGMYVMAIAGARLIGGLLVITYFGPMVFSIGGLFFSCLPADNLSTKSSEVALAVYEVPWYDLPTRGKIAVSIMLVRSQRPAKLTAGKYIAMSLPTFSYIVSNAMSFCMVLNSL